MIFSGSDLEGINTYFISFTKLFPLSFFVFPTTGCIKIVNLQGRLKSSRKLSAELTFNFQIENIGKQKQKDYMARISSSGLLLIYKQTLIRIVFPWGFFLSFFYPVCLQDSVLAFWRHGMQGRSFKTNEVRFILSTFKSKTRPSGALCAL